MAVDAKATISDRLRGYLEAWHSLDPAAVKSQYVDHATHRGPGVALWYPDLSDTTLKGAEAISQMAAENREALGDLTLDFVVTWALEDSSTSVVEYDVLPGNLRMCEIITWESDRVQQVHAYTLTALT